MGERLFGAPGQKLLPAPPTRRRITAASATSADQASDDKAGSDVADVRADQASDDKAGSDAADARSDQASDDKAGSDAADARSDPRSDQSAGTVTFGKAPPSPPGRSIDKGRLFLAGVGATVNIAAAGLGVGPADSFTAKPGTLRDVAQNFAEAFGEVRQEEANAEAQRRNRGARRGR